MCVLSKMCACVWYKEKQRAVFVQVCDAVCVAMCVAVFVAVFVAEPHGAMSMKLMCV